MSDRKYEDVRLSELANRNRNSSLAEGEVYHDATDLGFTGVYINKGFDCSESLPSNLPPGTTTLPHHSQISRVIAEHGIDANNNPTMGVGGKSPLLGHIGRRTSVVNFSLSDEKLANNSSNLDLIKNSVNYAKTKRQIIKKYSFYNRGASLVWNDLSFTVVENKWTVKCGVPIRKSAVKQILKPQNGEIFGGSLTALMGPSGAGKSTLLNCLTGRYMTGVKGEIYITTPQRGIKPRASISFVPQRDDLFGTFTVRETLIFASKMKNLDPGTNHEDEAERVMKDLNLESAAATTVSNCSGGQVKRVCIAVELISNPDILVLDEPTTGLDSSTAAQCVSLLKRLTEQKENPPAIVATIHQPNYKIFNDFHAVYLLSRFGQNIYFGSPLKIVDYFEKFNLICPSYCNPADFAIEVAYGDFGHAVFSDMEEVNRATRYTGEGRGTKFDMKKVIFKLRNTPKPTAFHSLALVWRGWNHMFRDSNQFWFKNILSVAIALIISYIWVYPVGTDDGCWEAFNSPVNTTDLKDNLFKINVTAAKDEYITKISRMADNSAFIFAVALFAMMVSLMECVLSFPLETSIILKEIGNNWYKTSAYFLSRTLHDIPPMLLGNIIVLGIAYPMTGQIPVLWRFAIFYLVVCLVSMIGQSIGMFVGILMGNDLISAALITVASSIPVILFAGFLVRYSGMPWYFRPFSHISYVKYGFESLLVVIYGFGRCKQSSTENFIDKLLASQDPVKIAQNMWTSLNITYGDVKRFSYLLNVEEYCLGSIMNATIDYLGLDSKWDSDSPVSEFLDKDSTELTTTLAPDYEDDTSSGGGFLPKATNPSYILSYYELDDSYLVKDLSILALYILILKVAIFILLRWKTRSTL